MIEFLTFCLVIVTSCVVWQAVIQNRSFIFEKKFKLYETLSENMYAIYMLEENTTSKVINTVEPLNFNNRSFQTSMYHFYIEPLVSLYGTIEAIKYIYINQKLKNILMEEVYAHS
jgi:hypothetical protein